jgi:phenylalanyl-tRNA synthetase alpha chain
MPTLSPAALARDLSVRDLTDPTAGPHALQLLVDAAVAALAGAWGCKVRVARRGPLVPVEDNYDRLGYPPEAVARDARYSRYVSESCMLRAHTTALVPPLLREMAASADDRPADLLLVCPGIVYRRDAIDRLHTGTPHQLDLWRIAGGPGPGTRRLSSADLDEMIALVLGSALPRAVHRTVPARHPYTDEGRQIDVRDGARWVEVGECGLAAPHVLAGNGLDPATTTGLAMGLGLDRLLMVRKGVPDIRLLRSEDPRVATQMLDLNPWRPVSSHPAVERHLSIVVDEGETAESLGDQVRDALAPDDRAAVEAVELIGETRPPDLPHEAAARLAIGPGQKNVLLKVVLRRLDRSLTRSEANHLRDRIHAALHHGGMMGE